MNHLDISDNFIHQLSQINDAMYKLGWENAWNHDAIVMGKDEMIMTISLDMIINFKKYTGNPPKFLKIIKIEKLVDRKDQNE